MSVAESPLVSLRYTLSLPEAQDGFRLATRQRKGKIHMVMTLACALIIAWGVWLGFDDKGRYFVILGAFFFLSQATLQYGVMPWLFKRQYHKHQVAHVVQGIDIYASNAHSTQKTTSNESGGHESGGKVTLYHGIADKQDKQNFALSEVSSLRKGQLCYVLVFESGMMCMIPRRSVEQTTTTAVFEQMLLKHSGSKSYDNTSAR
ncbi:hypothetical protein [Alkanindiges illinoisensis]|uniref:hypothetical protein n=1 Tax=Alkanindiges illinoisensis TaxID=197183 RepID=UPI0006865B65|nr:hypothetical protein [Alkanindiges illinoisensis]